MTELQRRFPIYSRLLSLYPRTYRQRYAEPTLQTLADMLDDPSAHRVGIWLRVTADLPVSFTRQQFLYLGDIMTHDTPNYVKITAVASGLMLLPFLSAVIANALTPGRLYSSWVWHYHILMAWVLILPALSAALSLTAFAAWSVGRRRAGISWWRSLTDLPHNWPMLIFAAAGLFIVALVFFHDSVRCVTGNPAAELQNWHQTWRCIQQR